MRWLAIGAALLVMAGAARAGPACPPALIDEAFLLAFPVSELVRTRAAALARADAAGAAPFNRFRHRRQLSTPADRGVTAPNVDTLYSAAWFDLSAGPLSLGLPAAGRRYVSVAVMDMAGDHVAVLHPAPDRPRQVRLDPPEAAGAQPAEGALRLPVRRGWIIARVFVAGPADLAAARAVQADIRLSGPVPAPPSGPVGNDTPERLLASVNSELAAGPAPRALAGLLDRLACTGLGNSAPDWPQLPQAVREAWTERMPKRLQTLGQGFATEPAAGGWRQAHPLTGRAAAPAPVRAAIALSGLGALPADEATYFRADVDTEGRPLDGRHAHGLRLPAELPASAFWSLTVYERMADGRLFLVTNPLQRHAINSASPGLRRDSDGTIPIRISRDPPAADQANWLPAPDGPLVLTLRLYRPTPPALDGRFVPPPVVREADAPAVPTPASD